MNTANEVALRWFSRALLAWFDEHRRALPWRGSPDAYGVWLSEIMLQQTRVDTVVPYYLRFLERYPSVTALAEAPLDEVLGAWSGLGYYRRARSLHAAAREVVERHGGSFPRELAALRSLPGIGAYTAGAIASIAFGLRTPLVDGNVARVLSRLFAVSEALGTSASERKLWSIAESLVPAERPGDFNQALMELGATVCAPERPRCELCPVAERCRARLEGRELELPVPRARKEPSRVGLIAAVVREPRGLLLARRPAGGLFGGLWEPPMVEGSLREARAKLSGAGVVLGPERGALEHVLTHRRLAIVVHSGRVDGSIRALEPYEELAFVLEPEGGTLGLSTMAKRVLTIGTDEAKLPRTRGRR
jgi:A/G-specific adenine glycosylase